ncbi:MULTISPECIES: plasmid replication protein, CyRepA1 family [Cyanophyceae]|uniref:plasmid replication protein, CyRepA1 family n=1 Tax=Cyanophyceae TaxID=3028117 RepID=UPI00168985FB|nr:plasmid replication protein, CyRepA1 family [Trichocoleus sp. FACHB-69]MBD1930374.1 hypothetical protein [Trichocoleus sp. FACHB-69]
MSQFKLFKRGSCPICNGLRKDCRENAHTQIVHCRADVVSAPGYRFIKQDTWGFNMWAVDRGQDSWNEQEWETHRRQLAAGRERRLQEEAKHFASLLNVEERDRQIRKLHQQLGLSTKHRQKLRDRGLTNAQIDAGLFFSIAPWQEISGINARLAGVDLWGKKLLIPASGIGCPVRDELGRLIGFQTRFDDATDSKYKWPTSRTAKRPNGATSHLPNGELPISCCRPATTGEMGRSYLTTSSPCSTQSIGLAEGFLKSYIAAQKLNCVVLGAAGGNFTASRQQLKEILEKLRAELSTHTVNLYPDAGAVANPAVMRQYQLTIELVQSLGYEVQVAWWGQLTKESPDIDELEDLEAIAIITPEEFLAKSQCQRQSSINLPLENALESEPDPEEYAAYVQREAAEEALEAAQAAQREQLQKEQYEQRLAAVQAQLSALSYPPTLSLNQRYLGKDIWDKLPNLKGSICGIKSPKNTGKTWALIALVEAAKRREQKVLLIYHRRILGREGCLKVGADYIDDIGVTGNYALSIELLGHNPTLGLCFDSLWKLDPSDWEGAILILDEVEQSLNHLMMSTTCEEKRGLLQLKFAKIIETVLSTGGQIIALDADLTDLSLNYIKAFAPDTTPVHLVLNTVLAPSWKVQFSTNAMKSGIEATIIHSVSAGKKIAVAVDSQKEAEALERDILNSYPNVKVLRIDRKTSEQELIKDFVKRPNEGLQALEPQVLIYTPTMGTGVSIDIPYFDVVVGMFFGRITDPEARQMLGRVRAPVQRLVWCKKFASDSGVSTSPLPDVVKRTCHQFHKSTSRIVNLAAALIEAEVDAVELFETAAALLKGNNFNCPHFDMWASLQARRNGSLTNLQERLIAGLKAEGHDVEVVNIGQSKETAHTIKGIKEELEWEEATALATAKDIPLEEAKRILKTDRSTEEQRFQARKAVLKDRLPGIELTPEFVYKAAIAEHGQWLRQIKLYWSCLNPDKVALLDKKTWFYHLAKILPFLPDIRTYSFQVKVLRDLRLLELIESGEVLSNSHPQVQQSAQRAFKDRRRIKTALNLTIKLRKPGDAKSKGQTPMQIVSRLLERLGVELEQLGYDHKQEEWLYGINEEFWHDSDRNGVLRALDEKYADLTAQVPAASNLRAEEPKQRDRSALYINNMERGDLPQSYIEQAVQTSDNAVFVSMRAVEEFGQFEPEDGYHISIKTCVQLLQDAVEKGIDAIKSLLKPWRSERRWGAVLLLERLSEEAFRRLEQMSPDFYNWLDESFLPLEGVG